MDKTNDFYRLTMTIHLKCCVTTSPSVVSFNILSWLKWCFLLLYSSYRYSDLCIIIRIFYFILLYQSLFQITSFIWLTSSFWTTHLHLHLGCIFLENELCHWLEVFRLFPFCFCDSIESAKIKVLCSRWYPPSIAFWFSLKLFFKDLWKNCSLDFQSIHPCFTRFLLLPV